MQRMVSFLAALTGLGIAFGQSSPPLTFEVASIRPHPEPPHSMGISTAGNRLTVEASYLAAVIMYAYNLKNYQIDISRALVPAAFDTMYDIAAKAEGDGAPTRDEFRQMLQTLLADRFKLKIHREMRETPIYALVINKNGSKLKPGSGDGECASRIGPEHPEDRNYRYQFTNCSLDPLVSTLAADRPILDKTALTGRYDISIFATPAFKMRDTSDPGDISVADAVQALGLRLDPQKVPVDVLIVDHVEKPSGN